MPRLKTDVITCDSNGSLWDVVLHTPGESLTHFVPGQFVRTRSGGRLLEVVVQDGNDVLCRLGERDVTLPRAILTGEVGAERSPRRGRPASPHTPSASAAMRIVPGALFDTAELTRMREEYAAASERLGLEGKPQLAREVAIAILRSATGRH